MHTCPGFDSAPLRCVIVFDSARFGGKRSALETMGEVVSFLRTTSTDLEQQIAGMRFLTRTVEEDTAQKKTTLRAVSTQSIRYVLSHSIKGRVRLPAVSACCTTVLKVEYASPCSDCALYYSIKGRVCVPLQ